MKKIVLTSTIRGIFYMLPYAFGKEVYVDILLAGEETQPGTDGLTEIKKFCLCARGLALSKSATRILAQPRLPHSPP